MAPNHSLGDERVRPDLPRRHLDHASSLLRCSGRVRENARGAGKMRCASRSYNAVVQDSTAKWEYHFAPVTFSGFSRDSLFKGPLLDWLGLYLAKWTTWSSSLRVESSQHAGNVHIPISYPGEGMLVYPGALGGEIARRVSLPASENSCGDGVEDSSTFAIAERPRVDATVAFGLFPLS